MADVKISELTALTTPDGAEELVVNDSGTTKKITIEDLFAGDNVKAKFGSSDDLEIYHDGSNSYIKETGTGYLTISSGTDLVLESAGGEEFIRAVGNEGVTSFYNGIAKLATTSTGVDISGTVTADGLVVDGGVTITKGGNDPLSIQNSTGTNVKFNYEDNSSNLGQIALTTGDFVFSQGNGSLTESMRISSGNVGIGVVPENGTSSTHTSLSIGETGTLTGRDNVAQISLANNAYVSGADFTTAKYIKTDEASMYAQHNGGEHRFLVAPSGTADSAISWTTAMTLDNSGNLLAGKTTIAGAFNTAGTELRASGLVQSTVDGSKCIDLNRLSSDGDILGFSKSGTSVGSIGTTINDLYIGTGDTTLRFADGSDAILPTGTNSATRDGAIDLGHSSHRFKDLYLSGGVIFGATGGSVSSKKLDDYEEGTWNPNYDNNSNTLSASYAEQSGSYTKIGRTVFISGVLSTSSLTRSGTWIKLEGLPYSVSNSGTNANGGLNVSVANDFAGDYPMSGYASLTHSFILQYRSTSNASTSFLQDGDMSTSGENKIIFSGFYFTDS